MRSVMEVFLGGVTMIASSPSELSTMGTCFRNHGKNRMLAMDVVIRVEAFHLHSLVNESRFLSVEFVDDLHEGSMLF